MDHIESHVARTDFAENRIQVRAVVIEQATGILDDILDLDDLALEHAQRGRIGQHDAGRFRADDRFERLDVDIARFVGGNLPDVAATHRSRCRVRAMRGVGHDDFVAFRVTVGEVIGANHRDTGEFSLRARHGRQRDGFHAGNRHQHLLQLVHAGEETLPVAFGTQWVAAHEARQQRHRVTDTRVVLHRARTQRIEVRVDREVLLRQARVVTDHLQLRYFGQSWRVVTAERRRDAVCWCVNRRLRKCAPSAP